MEKLQPKEVLCIKVCCFLVNLGLLTFSVFAWLKLEGIWDVSWALLSPPLLMSFILIPIMLHIFLHRSPDYGGRNLGSVMLIITAYTVFTLTIILAGLVAIKLDGWVDMTWSIVFIPLWLNIIVLLGFAFFMCPGFMDRKVGMHR